MAASDPTRPSELTSRYATARVARLNTGVTGWLGNLAWAVLHAMGAHRWRDGYETDVERGWSRYRGSRCTVCDEPWEGW
jgi:hypothetical protein